MCRITCAASGVSVAMPSRIAARELARFTTTVLPETLVGCSSKSYFSLAQAQVLHLGLYPDLRWIGRSTAAVWTVWAFFRHFLRSTKLFYGSEHDRIA